MKSISKTVYPDGRVIEYKNGAVIQTQLAPSSRQFNSWAKYIHSESLKTRMWNKIRPGGVCYSEGQKSALNQAKEILK